MWRTADDLVETVAGSMDESHRQLYAEHIEGTRRLVPRAQKLAAPVDGVVKRIEKALTTARPRARYVVGMSARAQATMVKVTPTPILDAALRKASGIGSAR
jgi:chemotaxis regulatin CheY-phosphate phosphatase CheZ